MWSLSLFYSYHRSSTNFVVGFSNYSAASYTVAATLSYVSPYIVAVKITSSLLKMHRRFQTTMPSFLKLHRPFSSSSSLFKLYRRCWSYIVILEAISSFKLYRRFSRVSSDTVAFQAVSSLCRRPTGNRQPFSMLFDAICCDRCTTEHSLRRCRHR